jgi:glycosyltransferase involved in cell wall biosynthesis
MITLAIPTYNRIQMVIDSFSEVIDDDRISEIVIMDDCSDIEIYQNMCLKLNKLSNSKIKIFRNKSNLGSFFNKLESVNKSSNDWVILFDSDNRLIKDYLDSIPSELDENTMYIPSHAMCDSPNLNYTKYSNKIIDINEYKTLSKIIDGCMLNTGNYLFNKDTYIKSVQTEKNIINSYALDAYYMIYLLYKNINNFKLNVVEGMKYHHHLHDNTSENEGSHYAKNANASSILYRGMDKMIELL